MDLVALSGMARRFDVKVKTVETWRARGLLPKPLPVDGATRVPPIWEWSTLERWGLDTGRLCKWQAKRHRREPGPILGGDIVWAVLPAHWTVEQVARELGREAGRGGVDPETLRPIGVERTTTELPASVRRTYGDWQTRRDTAEGQDV